MTDMRPTWDDVWMATARMFGQRSRCERGKIGCVLVSTDNQVVSASYVGPPPNYEPANTDPASTCSQWCARACKTDGFDPGYYDCVSSHAETNACARADFSRLKGGTAYVNGAVCYNCCKLLAASGVSRVVMEVYTSDAHRQPMKSINYLRDNSVTVDVHYPDLEVGT